MTGGLLYWNGDSDEASLNPAMAAAVLMYKYAPMASSPAKTTSYNVGLLTVEYRSLLAELREDSAGLRHGEESDERFVI